MGTNLSTRRASALATFALLCLLADSLHGQLFEFCDDFSKCACQQRDPWEERIETERHDFTQSAVTVGYHVAQLELGYSYFYKDTEDAIEHAHTSPEMLLRVGLTEDIEFRVRWNYVWIFTDDEPNEMGSEDLRYSLKFQLTREECVGSWMPTSAIELRGSAPTGGDNFTSGQVDFSLDYIYQWQVAERVTFAGSTGFGENGFGDFGLIAEDPSDNFIVITQSAVLGLELTEMNTMYVEWFGNFSTGREDEFVVSVFNIGVDHYVTDNFVLDIRAGMGLTDDSDDFFGGIGGGYRF